MPTRNSFDPADPLPRFLAGGPEPQDIGNVRAGGAIASRVFMSILVAAAVATGVAAVAMGDPVALFTDVTASLIGRPSPQPGTDGSPPAIQSADNALALIQSNGDAKADAETSPPTINEPPTRNEVAAAEPAAQDPITKGPTAMDPAAKDPAETIAPSSEALFRRFQTWLSEQDPQAKAESVQPVQDAPAQVEQNAPAQAGEHVRAPRRLAQKHRQAAAVRRAHAEMRTQNVRRQIQRAQDARAARPPLQDARAQEPSAGPNTPAPSFLPPVFGQRN
jgi:hypothetical protein